MSKVYHSIILARSGSKGIKNKNIVFLKKKPLIYWTIKNSLNSKKITSTWVSSDSDKILKIAKKCGARTIKRPAKFAKDKSSSDIAMIHAIKEIHKKKLYPDTIVALQPTSPLRIRNHIDLAINQFNLNKYDSLFSSCIIKDHFIWKKTKGKLEANYDIWKRKPRQSIETKYLENGSIYIFKTKDFLIKKNRLYGKIGNFIMEKRYGFQIDEPEDLKIIGTLINIK